MLIHDFILERDNYKCSRCGSDDRLIVHHVIPLSMNGNNDLSNLITICNKCHAKIHREMIDEYLSMGEQVRGYQWDEL